MRVGFRPRRLGHANLFVRDLEGAATFFNKICGIEEVRREPGISACFLSNGNTHHDVAAMELGESDRVGIDGYLQVDTSRMRKPGLNHLGWEMETEKVLVDAYRAAREAGVEIFRTSDHQISHSVYLFDPDGNQMEFYADAMQDWRSVFNPEREDLVTSAWDPEQGPANEDPMYDPEPALRRVETAMFHGLRITHAAIVAQDLDEMARFYTEVAGLEVCATSPDRNIQCLRGSNSTVDLTLVAPTDGLKPGLHHISFAVADEEEVARGEAALDAAGIEPLCRFDNAFKRSVFVPGPDNVAVEFCCLRSEDVNLAFSAAGGGSASPDPFLV